MCSSHLEKRKSGWARAGTALVAVAIGLGVCAPANAATVIGSLHPGSGPTDYCGGSPDSSQTVAQTSTSAATPSYAVPAGGGVIVSWMTQAMVAGESVKFKALRPTTTPNDLIVVGESGPLVLQGPGLHSLAARDPVQAGDRIGLTVPAGARFTGCVSSDTGQATDVLGVGSTDPPVGSPFTAAAYFDGLTLNVAAVVEPDADRDGFGDESQDACPTSAATQGSCPLAQPAQPRKKCKRKKGQRAAEVAKKKRCKKRGRK